MDVETFQRILDMVEKAGEGAFLLAVLYMLIPLLVNLLWAVFFFVLAVMVFRSINQHVAGSRLLNPFAQMPRVSQAKRYDGSYQPAAYAAAIEEIQRLQRASGGQ